MAYPSPRRLQLRRGNAAAVANYLGTAGELAVDTTNWTLYVHDGVTVGGYAATVNTATLTNQITSVNANITIANVGMRGYVDLANTIQSQQITAANLGIIGYVNQANTIQSAQITSANLGIIGYVNQANTIQSAQITAANVGMQGYVDATIRANIANIAVGYSNVNVKAYTETMGFQNFGNVNVAAYVTTSNSAIIGYIDRANTIQSAQVGAANLAIAAANVGLKGYVDLANTIQSAQVGAANLTITAANVGMRGYVDSQSFYSNVKVATYLPTYDGNIAANISKAGYTWTFGTDGTTSFPNTLILAPAGQSITMQSDQYSQLMWENANVTVAPNMAINSNFYVAQNNATLDIGYRDGSGTQLIKSWYWSVDGNLKLPSGGYILNSDDSIYGGGAGNYGNVDVKAFLETDAGPADNFERKIEGYYANLILGDSTKLFSFGNSSKSYFGHDGFANININYVRADNSDVRIATNNGAYTWKFDNAGNLTLSGNTFSVNYANGTPVTFSSSSYSNVQVATYLPTYSGVVTASNVAVAGNVTAQYLFGNGSQLTGIASSYSNVEVAAYLNATGYNLYSNVNVASYLTTATITTTGNVTAGNLITGGALYVANITTTGSSGNISGANYITANVILTNGGWGNISQVALITANVVTATSYIKVTPTTVANLISASTAGAGARDFVTDANTITFGSVVGGSGANNMPVFSNGTSWLIG